MGRPTPSTHPSKHLDGRTASELLDGRTGSGSPSAVRSTVRQTDEHTGRCCVLTWRFHSFFDLNVPGHLNDAKEHVKSPVRYGRGLCLSNSRGGSLHCL